MVVFVASVGRVEFCEIPENYSPGFHFFFRVFDARQLFEGQKDFYFNALRFVSLISLANCITDES